MASRPPVYYAYLLIAFGLVILGISMWAMIRALSYYDAGDYPSFFVYGIMAAVGTVLALSSITQMRRRMVTLQHLRPALLPFRRLHIDVIFIPPVLMVYLV